MKKSIFLLLSVAALPAAAQLRITEICPQPAAEHPSTHEVIDALDPNGKVSGWIELENTSATETVDLANYQIVRTHRGKKVKDKPYSASSPKNDGPSMLPSRQIGPGERVLVYTSDEYDNDEEVDGLGLIVKRSERGDELGLLHFLRAFNFKDGRDLTQFGDFFSFDDVQFHFPILVCFEQKSSV